MSTSLRQLNADNDAAKRVHDTYALHRLADPIGNIGQWFAVKLSDGTSDGQLYPDKTSCILHQKGDERQYGYVKIVPANMSVQDALTFLKTYRKLYDAGFRLVDRDSRAGGVSLIKRSSHEDQLAMLRSMSGRGKPRNIVIDGVTYN